MNAARVPRAAAATMAAELTREMSRLQMLKLRTVSRSTKKPDGSVAGAMNSIRVNRRLGRLFLRSTVRFSASMVMMVPIIQLLPVGGKFGVSSLPCGVMWLVNEYPTYRDDLHMRALSGVRFTHD
ncbi:hypothetical protein M8818_001340 [Zalaria obscura]|uniref:Uncharacterized protein n=1 Tax=Zalaria obscura TaxID=2024903 RepID=A0ACC3SKW7_9PEZI